ncbi:MAG: hypothetical protein IPI82_09260 [Candidatus Microthrix sp.]|nr:hypothetical protein [Candidatus Microthrix sp.]
MCGIVDGAHIPLVSQLGDYGIDYLNTHHEEAATHIAEAHARIGHRPTVVIGNPGPGGANMLAGLTSAHGEGGTRWWPLRAPGAAPPPSPNGPAPGRPPTWWTWPGRSPSIRR